MATARAGRRKLSLGAVLLGQLTGPLDAILAGRAGAAAVTAPPSAGGAPHAHAVDAVPLRPAAEAAGTAVGGVEVQLLAGAVATGRLAAGGGGTDHAARAAVGRVVIHV
jgi:hypothetical protein